MMPAEQAAAATQQQAQVIPTAARYAYEQTRNFYSSGVRSSNVVPEQGVADQATVADYTARMARAGGLPDLRDLPDQTTIAMGILLRQSNNTFGNCSHMASVAAASLWEHYSSVPVTRVSLPDAIDHTFLMVGATPPPPPGSLNSLRNCPPNAQSYVVDPWAGLCCHTSEYPGRLEAKMLKWQDTGVRYLDKNNRPRDFRGQDMIDFMNAPMTPLSLEQEKAQHWQRLNTQTATQEYSDWAAQQRSRANKSADEKFKNWQNAPNDQTLAQQYREAINMRNAFHQPGYLAMEYYKASALNSKRAEIASLTLNHDKPTWRGGQLVQNQPTPSTSYGQFPQSPYLQSHAPQPNKRARSDTPLASTTPGTLTPPSVGQSPMPQHRPTHVPTQTTDRSERRPEKKSRARSPSR
jgi:hypothetical protein